MEPVAPTASLHDSARVGVYYFDFPVADNVVYVALVERERAEQLRDELQAFRRLRDGFGGFGFPRRLFGGRKRRVGVDCPQPRFGVGECESVGVVGFEEILSLFREGGCVVFFVNAVEQPFGDFALFELAQVRVERGLELFERDVGKPRF